MQRTSILGAKDSLDDYGKAAQQQVNKNLADESMRFIKKISTAVGSVLL
jgi:hypothetical protein